MQLPVHRLELRDYQKELIKNYNDPLITEILAVIARRGGKTTTFFGEGVVPDLVREVQTIVMVYPTAKMGFRNFWNNIENDGFKTIERIPDELIKRKSSSEDDMRIELINGSVFMVVGATNTEALRGANGKKYIFDEFADMPIEAVNVVAPIIEANGGKMIYMGTPKIDGINGETMRRMHEAFKNSPSKYTCYVNATNYMTPEQLEASRQGYITRNGNDFKFRQEMMLDWGQSSSGSYYGEIIMQKKEDGSIGQFPYDRSFPVYTAWDLGRSDSMVILFFQNIYGEVRIIDLYETHNLALDSIASYITSKPYVYGWHFLPHDGTVASLNDNVRRIDFLKNVGLHNSSTLKREGVTIGIDRVLQGLPDWKINSATTGDMVRKLSLYRRKFNPMTGDYIGPDHASESHVSDTVRYLAAALFYFFNERGECKLSSSGQSSYKMDMAEVNYF